MKTKIMTSFFVLMMVVFGLVGCYEVPESIYTPIDADEENAKTPVISSVDKAYMFTDETLTISGENFSDSTDENFVYFYEVNEPVVGDTTETQDSLTTDGSYSLTTNFKTINISTSDYVTTISSTVNGVTTVTEYRTPTSTAEYTLSDSDQLVLTAVDTEPVFTSFDTTMADSTAYDTTYIGGNAIITSRVVNYIVGIDTTGYTKMKRTVTSYNNISEWVSHTATPAEVISATPTELQVIPPDIDAVNSKITIHVQDAIAPAQWGYIDLMVKP
ncbi:MAG: hypothetical protein U5N56_13305 [Candidatus Marinimicrobia bacterium]|nr:hypothetical protein [Candidatus Neomarinimicrobiota bacterium]